jgi:hypothetical protein
LKRRQKLSKKISKRFQCRVLGKQVAEQVIALALLRSKYKDYSPFAVLGKPSSFEDDELMLANEHILLLQTFLFSGFPSGQCLSGLFASSPNANSCWQTTSRIFKPLPHLVEH